MESFLSEGGLHRRLLLVYAMKTTAAILEKLNEPLFIKELEIPPLKRGQVLVKMAYSGICQSQLNEMRGYKGPDRFLPHTLGHEGSGTVLDIGPDVTKVQQGDPVVLSWIKGSGIEAGGSHYVDQMRTINSGPISTFLSYAVISENRVIPIAPAMPLREAALLGCAIPTGAGVVLHEMRAQKGQSMALFGLGGIGLSALMAAAHIGAEPIIAVDIAKDKLDRAKEFGATHLVDASKSNPFDEIMEITQAKGVDFSLEAAGRKDVIESAYSVLKAPGGLCIVAGNVPLGQKIAIDPFDLIKGKRIVGTWGGGGLIEQDVKTYSDLFMNKSFPLSRLITREVPLVEINALCDAMIRGHVGRGMVQFV